MSSSMLPLFVLSFLTLSSLTPACYIQNCPRGGKRSIQDEGIRQCMACGPGDRGHCFGPSICCGAALGCSIGSPEAAVCVEENYLSSPCETGGRACGSEGGHCAAPGLCCDTESCILDSVCLEDSKYDLPVSEAEGASLSSLSPGEKLLHFLRLATRRRGKN